MSETRGSFPDLPRLSKKGNRLPLPPDRAAIIDRVWAVYFNPDDGSLVCPAMDRFAELVMGIRYPRNEGSPLVLHGVALNLWLGALRPVEPGEYEREQEEAQEAVLAALGIIVARLWKRGSTEEKRLLKEEAEGLGLSVTELRQRLVEAGILRAFRERRDQTQVRIGSSWVTGPDGKKATVFPADDLNARDFIRFLWGRGIRYARELVREDVPRDRFSHPGEIGEVEDQSEAVEAEDRRIRNRSLDALRHVATPRQLEILDALEALDGDRGAVAAHLGISPSTLRVQLLRLRKKAP